MAMKTKARFTGCLLGLAVGDALGTTVEFKSRGTFEPVSDMTGGGPFELEAGQWTDDTSMALCLGHSLLHKRSFNPKDQMNRYCNWWQYGYMSSTGECFDIGNTVAKALDRYLKTGMPFAGSSDPNTAGNGSLMRLAPIVIYFMPDVDKVVQYAKESSRTTHGAAECIDACGYFANVLANAMTCDDKQALFERVTYEPYTPGVGGISDLGFISKSQSHIRGSGYVIDSLEAAFWCFWNTDNFKDAVLTAANLGDDADTTAAICGQIAGAFYGAASIPADWLELLHEQTAINELAEQLAVINYE